MTTTIKGQLTISDDGVIWFNQYKDGRCVLRIQKVGILKIQNWKLKQQLIDIRIDDKNE